MNPDTDLFLLKLANHTNVLLKIFSSLFKVFLLSNPEQSPVNLIMLWLFCHCYNVEPFNSTYANFRDVQSSNLFQSVPIRIHLSIAPKNVFCQTITSAFPTAKLFEVFGLYLK